MAKITGNHPALIQALKNAGVDTDNATRVVIDVQVGELVKVYVPASRRRPPARRSARDAG
jgi:hypothetical protein